MRACVRVFFSMKTNHSGVVFLVLEKKEGPYFRYEKDLV